MEKRENNNFKKLPEYIELGVSLLASAASLYVVIKDTMGMRYFGIILFLIAISGLVFYFYRTLNRKTIPIISTSFTGPKPDSLKMESFKEALPYTIEDAHRFFGRQNDVSNIMNQIRWDGYRIGVLHGESGVGKTSIIQAGLIPELNDRKIKWGYVSLNYLPNYIASANDLENFLVQRLRKKFNLPGVRNLKGMAKRLTSESKGNMVLFLDQFEQIFDRSGEEVRKNFAQYLEDCCRSVYLLKIVISVREDYFGRVFNMFKSIERNTISNLSKFNMAQAREVIRISAGFDLNLHIKNPGHPLLGFEKVLLEDIQDSDGRIQPVELSLICSTILNEKGELDVGVYVKGGKKQGWLERYLENVLKGHPQQKSLHLLNALIEGDKTAMLTVDDISARSGFARAEAQQLLNYFQQSRLVVEEGENDEKKYRLVHDYLINPIRLNCEYKELSMQKYNRLLNEQFHAWEKDKHNSPHLLKGKNLFMIRFLYKEQLGWDTHSSKKNFVRMSFRRYLSIIVSYILAIATLIGVFGYSYSLYTINEDNRVKNYLTALKLKSASDLRNFQPELVELSNEPIGVKMKTLGAVLTDNAGCYKDDIMPVFFHTLIGISTNKRNKVVQYILNHFGSENLGKIYASSIWRDIGPAERQLLINKLRDIIRNTGDEIIKVKGAYMLGMLGDVDGIETLVKILKTSQDFYVQNMAAEALGEIKNKESAHPLIEILENSKDHLRQRYAVTALGAIGDMSALVPLISLLQNNNDSFLQSVTISALGTIGDKRAVERLTWFLKNSSDFGIKTAAASALGKIRDEKTVGPLLETLEKIKDIYVQEAAAAALGEIKNVNSIDPLIEILAKNKDDSITQCCAISALEKIGNAKANDHLIKLLKNNNYPDVQKSAASALGKIKSQEAVTHLLEILYNSMDTDVRNSAIAALGEIGNDKAVDRLIKLLKDNDEPSNLVSAACALGKIKNVEAVDSLKSLLVNSDIDVQVAAADALGEIGFPARVALISMRRLYKNEKYCQVKFAIARAMIKIDPSDQYYLKLLMEEILPLPSIFFPRSSSINEPIKLYIFKIAGIFAGKEKAGENFDFGGNMWKMLEWWEKFKVKSH